MIKETEVAESEDVCFGVGGGSMHAGRVLTGTHGIREGSTT